MTEASEILRISSSLAMLLWLAKSTPQGAPSDGEGQQHAEVMHAAGSAICPCSAEMTAMCFGRTLKLGWWRLCISLHPTRLALRDLPIMDF